MAYPELVALIDSKLARLKIARDILSSPGVPDQLLSQLRPSASSAFSHSPETPPSSMNRTPVNIPAIPVAAPIADPQAAPVSPIVARARRLGRRGSRGPRKPAEALPSALRSATPAGPVFVPAARLADNVAAAAAPPAAEPLTASLLARRWLNATS